MISPAQIGSIGEKHATAWLSGQGFTCYRNTQLPGCTDIECSAGNKSLLVQVKTAIHPESPAYLSAEEKNAIVSRANRNGSEAWLARLQINEKGALVGKIMWSKLN